MASKQPNRSRLIRTLVKDDVLIVLDTRIRITAGYVRIYQDFSVNAHVQGVEVSEDELLRLYGVCIYDANCKLILVV